MRFFFLLLLLLPLSLKQASKPAPRYNNVRDFGAKPNDGIDDRAAIQRAIDAPGPTLIAEKGYEVSLNHALRTPEGGTGIALVLPSDETVTLKGSVRLMKGQVGASSVIFGNTKPVRNVRLIGPGVATPGTIDGNRRGTTGQTILACLWNATNCRFENIRAVDGTYFGLGFRSTGSPAQLTRPGYGRNQIIRCTVDNVAYIGVQLQYQHLGASVTDCRISRCGDNGIDIEGNNPQGEGIGRNYQILRNQIERTLNGIFFESVGNGTCTGNVIRQPTTHALVLNRINSGAFGVKFTGNKLYGAPGKTAILVNNNSGRMQVEANRFDTWANGIAVNGTGLELTIGPNDFYRLGRYAVYPSRHTNALIRSTIAPQRIHDARNARTGFPRLLPPTTNPRNAPDRVYEVKVQPTGTTNVERDPGGARTAAAGSAAESFVRTTARTARNPNWGSHAVFYNGRTLVYIPTGTVLTGDYLEAGDTYLLIAGMPEPGVYWLQDSKKANGDFTKAIPEGTVKIYYPQWMTD